MTLTAIPDVVGKKSTVLSARQWQARGIPPARLRSLVRAGQLIRVRRGAYATKRAADWAGADPVRAHVLQVLAAQATVRGNGKGNGKGNGTDNAVASYHSAALLHRLSLLTSPPPATVTLTLPPARKWNRAQPADIVFHASELPKQHVTRLYKLPLTTVARTVTDLARTLPFADAVVTADSALNQEKTTKPELMQALELCKNWPGVKQARRAIEFADERAESPLESAARVVFAEAGLDPPELQVTIHGNQFAARVDFLWRAQKVIAEADGLVKYNDRTDLLKERERDHQLREAGYTVVHFTWQELFHQKEAKEEANETVLTRVSAALNAGLAPVDRRP